MGATPFQIEAWTEYGIGLLVLLTRIGFRMWSQGRNLDGDDYFAFIAVFFWTGELVMLELIGQYGSITGMTDEVALTLSDEEIRRIVIGSKCLLAGWILYVTLIWCLKACMLFLYRRLTLNLQQQKFVKYTAVACVLAWLATIIVILTRCLPLHKNWQVYPYPGDACALNIPNYLALVVTNVTTDLMILYIPLPLLWSVQLPLTKKILYGLWLCTGVFIITATILRCVLCLSDVDSINLGTIWSIRETFVGIIAVNLPIMRPWLAHGTAFIREQLSKGATDSSHPNSSAYSEGKRKPGEEHQLTIIERKAKEKRIRRGMGWTTIDNDSEENIVKPLDLDPNRHNAHSAITSVREERRSSDSNADGIVVKSTYEVSRAV